MIKLDAMTSTNTLKLSFRSMLSLSVFYMEIFYLITIVYFFLFIP